jgi:hypothetical protein
MPFARLFKETWEMFMKPGIRVIQQVSSEISAISLEFDYTVTRIALLNARMAFNKFGLLWTICIALTSLKGLNHVKF